MKDSIDVQFRIAGIGDLDLLRHWDEQPHVIAATDDDWGWEKELLVQPAWRVQLIAELDGRPIGFVQIIDPALEETHYWGAGSNDLRAIDIWIGEADDLGKGYGTTMMQLALARCFAEPAVRAVIIDPLATNIRAHTFYKRLGLQFVESKMFLGDLCFIFKIDREDWETEN